MKLDEKQQLLTLLCGMLPHGIKVKYRFSDIDLELVGIVHSEHGGYMAVLRPEPSKGNRYPMTSNVNIEYVKPYLRPMSSMKAEEKDVYDGIRSGIVKKIMARKINYLSKIRVDYMDMIGAGIAIEAPAGMYD